MHRLPIMLSLSLWLHILLLRSSIASTTEDCKLMGQEVVACGSACDCKDRVLSCVGTKVNCLTTIPTVIDPKHTFLDLDFHNNKIKDINPTAWHLYPWAESLILKQNYLTHITRESFEGLLPLKFLDLSYNQIEKIDPHSFEPVPLLQTLNLAGNRLHELQGGTFSAWHGLQFLAFIVISHNPLVACDDQALYHLPSLKYIDVGATKIPIPAIKLLMIIPPNLEKLILPYSTACCLCLVKKRLDYFCDNVRLHCPKSCHLNTPLCQNNKVLPIEGGKFLKSLRHHRMHRKVTLNIEPERGEIKKEEDSGKEAKNIRDKKQRPLNVNEEINFQGGTNNMLPKNTSYDEKMKRLKFLGSKKLQVNLLKKSDLSKLGLLGQRIKQNLQRVLESPKRTTAGLYRKKGTRCGSVGCKRKVMPSSKMGKVTKEMKEALNLNYGENTPGIYNQNNETPLVHSRRKKILPIYKQDSKTPPIHPRYKKTTLTYKPKYETPPIHSRHNKTSSIYNQNKKTPSIHTQSKGTLPMPTKYRKTMPIYHPNETCQETFCIPRAISKRQRRNHLLGMKIQFLDRIRRSSVTSYYTKSFNELPEISRFISKSETTDSDLNFELHHVPLAHENKSQLGNHLHPVIVNNSELYPILRAHENQNQLEDQLEYQLEDQFRQAIMNRSKPKTDKQSNRQMDHKLNQTVLNTKLYSTEPNPVSKRSGGLITTIQDDVQSEKLNASSKESEGNKYETQLYQQLKDLIPDTAVRGLVCHLVRLLKTECTDPKQKLWCAKLMSRTGLLMRSYSLHEHRPEKKAWKRYIKPTEKENKKQISGYKRKFILSLCVTAIVMSLISLICLIEICSRKKFLKSVITKKLLESPEKKKKEKNIPVLEKKINVESSEDEIYSKPPPKDASSRKPQGESINAVYSCVVEEQK